MKEDSLLNKVQYYPIARLDRANFVYDYKINYIDCCPPRPLIDHYSSISDIHKKLNIYNPERDISFKKKLEEIIN